MMHYEDIIQPLESLTLEQAIDIARKLVPEEYKHKPWALTKHGTNVIDDIDGLAAYLAAYGEMHTIKCRAACQNFPFNELNRSVEIVDWGCGQGIASMALLELLKDRNLHTWVRQITLVEPSNKALQRALTHIAKLTGKSIQHNAVRAYLPGAAHDVMESLTFRYPITIHLFSNILDIPSIDLDTLSKMVSGSGNLHFVLCMGPINSNAPRIDQFCQYFNPDAYFSDIFNFRYGITSDTHYQFSCRTKCFQFERTKSQWSDSHVVPQPVSTIGYDSFGCYNEFEQTPLILDQSLPQELVELYSVLSCELKPHERIFIRPSLDGARPDLLRVVPERGISLINIFSGNKKEIDDALVVVKDIRTNLLANSNRWFSCEEDDCKDFIETCIYTPSAEAETGYETIQDPIVDFSSKNNPKSAELCQVFLDKISPKWHSFREGKPLNLTLAQQKLSLSAANKRQKIRGMAGSGKTQVLATRAVNAQLRTGSPVLILTFNITVINYIRYKISQIPADFSLGHFEITNYHEFIKTQARNCHKRINSLSPFDNSTFFDDCKATTKRYSTIFIDEIQDYKEEWLRTVKNYFLAEDGEWVVFGDIKQNVYGHCGIDEKKEISIPGIPGAWNRSLNKGFRFSTGKLTDLAMTFQRHFFKNDNWDTILNEPTLSLENETFVRYAEIKSDTDYKTLARWILAIICRFKLEEQKTAVLASNHQFLREIEWEYRDKSKKATTTMFYIQKDNWSKHTDGIHDKTGFTMDTPYLKLSTIYSFKGWEADSIILIIGCDERNNELIYTAITRARKNLFVFNLGNARYDEFFKQFAEKAEK